MDWPWWSVASVGGQMFAGALLACRPRRAARSSAPRRPAAARLRRAAWRPGGAALVVAAAALVARSPAAAPDGTLPLAIVCGAASAVGVAGLLAAARLERRGRVGPARRLTRAAGRHAVAGAIATLALPPAIGAYGPAAGGIAVAALLQGTIALPAALSRKPRPAAWLVTVAWLVAATLLGRLSAG